MGRYVVRCQRYKLREGLLRRREGSSGRGGTQIEGKVREGRLSRTEDKVEEVEVLEEE